VLLFDTVCSCLDQAGDLDNYENVVAISAVYSHITRHTLRLIPIIATLFMLLPSRTAAAQPTVTVSVDGASIWSAPSMPAVVLATVKVGTTLEVLARVGLWYRVRLPNDSSRTGYIQVRQVEGKVDNIPSTPEASGQPRAVGPRRGPPRRSFVTASGGYLPTILDFDTTASFTVFLEEGTRNTTYTTQRAAILDVSGGHEVHRNLFVGAAVSWAKGSTDADIDQKIPHPFFFEQMRTLEATAARLPREEIAVHFQAAWLTQLSRRVQFVVAGGPSLFRLRQTFVTDVVYTDTYPFDVVEFGSTSNTSEEKTAVGGNVQANVITMLNRQVGVDAVVRFSRASLRFPGSEGSTFSVPAGGVHIALGLRAEF
jgi:hypothetical protein